MDTTVKMSNDRFTDILDEQIEKCRQMLLKKAEEYAGDEDRLHNFRVAAALTGTSMRQALAGMMLKHTVSIYDMCYSDEDYTLGMWEEKIGDHLNYLLLLKAIVAEDIDKVATLVSEIAENVGSNRVELPPSDGTRPCSDRTPHLSHVWHAGAVKYACFGVVAPTLPDHFMACGAEVSHRGHGYVDHNGRQAVCAGITQKRA